MIAFFTFLQLLFVSAHGGGVGVQVYGKKAIIEKNPLTTNLEHNNNINYYGTIWLGTPRKPFKVIFDTGSTDLAVFKPGFRRNCPSKEEDPGLHDSCNKAKHQVFDPSKSSTFEGSQGTMSIRYTDGTAYTGNVAYEYMELGDGKSKIRVRIAIGTAYEVHNESNDTDGMLGLGFGFSSFLRPRTLSPLESIFTQTDIPEQLGCYLTRDEDANDERRFGGEIYFGGYNPNYLASSLMGPVPCISEDGIVMDWGMAMKSVKVGNKVISLEREDEFGRRIPWTPAVPDTGAVDFAFTQPVFDQIKSYFPRESQWIFTDPAFLCADFPDILPDITLIVNENVKFTLGPEDYISTERNGLICRLVMIPTNNSYIFLGNYFLHKYYTVFDYGKKEMLFALSKRTEISAANIKKSGERLLSAYSPADLQTLRTLLKVGQFPEFQDA